MQPSGTCTAALPRALSVAATMLVAAHGAVLAMAATLTHAATPGTAFATSEASPMGHRLLQVASADDTGSGLHAYTDGHDGPADAVALQQAHSVGSGSGGASRRKLLHGCHGQKRCRRFLPVCDNCRFPQSRSGVGHCRKHMKVHNCYWRSERWNQGDEFEHEEDGGGGGNPEETYYEPGLVMAVPEADISAVPSYEYDAEDIQRFYEFAYVATPEEFQEVLEDGVKHIEIIAHLDMRGSSYAVGSVQSGTVSIVGRCNEGPAPPEFGLAASSPPFACAVLVEGGFIDIPASAGPRGTGLLLEGLHVKAAPPPGSADSTLLLHADGELWISHSVFEGGGRNCRAIEVNTADGGFPELHAQVADFVGFTHELAPGILVGAGAKAVLDDVAFLDMELLPPRGGPVIEASAIAAYPNSTLWLYAVAFGNNIVYGQPAGDQTVALAKGPLPATAYAMPQMTVWQWPGGPAVPTEPEGTSNDFFFDYVQDMFQAVVDAHEAHVATVSSYFE